MTNIDRRRTFETRRGRTQRGLGLHCFDTGIDVSVRCCRNIRCCAGRWRRERHSEVKRRVQYSFKRRFPGIGHALGAARGAAG